MITRKHATTAALVAVLALAPVTLSACSSESASTAASPSASATPLDGSNPGTWSPVHVTTAEAGTTIDLVPDQVALIEIDTTAGTDLLVKTDNDQVVTVEQAEGSGDITAVPAVIAKAPGDATITVQQIDDSTDQEPPTVLEFTVHVAK